MINEEETNAAAAATTAANEENNVPLSKNARKRRAKKQLQGPPKVLKQQQQPQGVKKFSNKWMDIIYEEKPPFPEELFETCFSQEKVESLVAALKAATEKEVAESNRLLEDDYTYSVQITSHKVPHVPVHLSRM